METEDQKMHPFVKVNPNFQKLIFVILLILCLTAGVTPPIALLLGLIVANVSGHPFLPFNHIAIRYLLQFSVVGLGFGMNVYQAMAIGSTSFIFTVVSIISTIAIGLLLGKWFLIDRKTVHLISCGTAICGGSAIAAIAPIIKSDEKQTSVALGVIFILNSIALFLFPAIGHWLQLSQQEFGLWCAIAIHDTSSVVGAANKYGAEALSIATTVKLARALWIIPVALVTTIAFKNKSKKINIPYFIGFFIIAMFLNTYVPQISVIAPTIVLLAKIGLTITLFLIGSGLNLNVLLSVGFKPLLHGVLLWLFIASMSLVAIRYLI
ncbi:YeiH family protein [Flavobacterium algicola]|uniref:YeiH family protein n=1 Tax=Flavobacterium algicola TaxID=556529 RepID=UPI001EFE7E43|nr:putative sulfate exporter family transporter [Flavobacterium algicola]MCG9792707.1 putative sulfate exporter family transporter [Flavobacterium algicola]